MTVRTHTFNGRKYKIEMSGNLDGWCDQYKMGDNQRYITIMAKEGTRNELETIVHESLHACNWRASEQSVEMTAHDIARFLWRLGYRVHK